MNKIRNTYSSKIHNGFDDDLNTEDSFLFETAGDFIIGMADIEDVRNDPAYAEMKITADNIVRTYNDIKIHNRNNEAFIKDAFSGRKSVDTESEISSIKKDISDNKVNEITAEWVKEWHEKKQKSIIKKEKPDEIADFVSASLNSIENKEVAQDEVIVKSSPKTPFVKYATLAAAAFVGIFLIINTLIPSSDPAKIFDSYYKPFEAMSSITRSIEGNTANDYSAAIAHYKNGEYARASEEFKAISDKEPGVESPKFFTGLSQMALDNYSQAIPLLSEVSAKPGEYVKEARWYLGLAYLKVSDKEKARECFEYLSRSEGYYRERSEKILRRLK
jgi:TolA-binding protein